MEACTCVDVVEVRTITMAGGRQGLMLTHCSLGADLAAEVVRGFTRRLSPFVLVLVC